MTEYRIKEDVLVEGGTLFTVQKYRPFLGKWRTVKGSNYAGSYPLKYNSLEKAKQIVKNLSEKDHSSPKYHY